jgi:hypothetical protein
MMSMRQKWPPLIRVDKENKGACGVAQVVKVHAAPNAALTRAYPGHPSVFTLCRAVALAGYITFGLWE